MTRPAITNNLMMLYFYFLLYILIAENLDTNSESRAVFSYLQYSRNTSSLMPLNMDESVSRRWGVNMTIGSPIIQVALFVPEYVWMKESSDGEDNSLENNMEDIEGMKSHLSKVRL